MEDAKKGPSVSKISRHKLVQNSRDNFYANLVQVHKDNKNAPVLEAAPSTKKPLPSKPTSGTFSRAGAAPTKPDYKFTAKPASSTKPAQKQAQSSTQPSGMP